MAAHADRYSPAFSLHATSGKYPKVSFADYEAGKVKEKDLWLYSSFWYKDFDGMAYKTMLRQILSKWGVMSVEMQKAFEADMRVINENGVAGDIVDADYSEVASMQDVVNANESETIEVSPVQPDSAATRQPDPAPSSSFQIICPKNGKQVDELECSGKPCREGCPEFE